MPYMRAKILYSAVAILNTRIEMDSARIEGLTKSKRDLSTALALCENTVSNNAEAIAGFIAINKNNSKKWRNRTFYIAGGGFVLGFVGGLLVR